MTRETDNPAQMARLTHVLEAYGSDQDRWPEIERPALEGFIRENQAAQKLLAEFQALDTLLDRSETFEPAADLADRIVQIAETAGHSGNSSQEKTETNVVSFPPPPRSARRTTTHQSLAPRFWPAAGLMAASLLFGIYIGMNDFAGSSLLNVTGTQVADLDSSLNSELDTFFIEESFAESLISSEDLQ